MELRVLRGILIFVGYAAQDAKSVYRSEHCFAVIHIKNCRALTPAFGVMLIHIRGKDGTLPYLYPVSCYFQGVKIGKKR